MNIFIDANIVYKDPFFQKSYPKKLIEYAEHKIVKIYLSSIIQEEIKNNYKKELQSEYSRYKTSVNKLNEFLPEKNKVEFKEIDIVEHSKKLENFYDDLSFREVIEIFEYSNEILPELIERSIKKIKPFNTNKTELRDATFWLSINEYIKENEMKECVLLTNNTDDFFNSKKDDLHEDLKKDNPDIEVFKDIRDFFDVYDDELLPEKTNKLLDDLIEEETFDNRKLIDILNDNFTTKLNSEYMTYFSNIHPEDLDCDIFDGYLDPQMGIECLDVENIDIDKDIFSEILIINGTAQIFGFVDVFAYNPVYDKGEDKFFIYETKEITISMEFNFSYDLNHHVSNLSITKKYI